MTRKLSKRQEDRWRFWGLIALASVFSQPHETVAATDFAAKPSFYSQRILKFLEHWPPAIISQHDARPVFIRAVRSPEAALKQASIANEKSTSEAGGSMGDLIGFVKHCTVDFPLRKVVELTERFEEYPKIWDDVLSVTVVSRAQGRVLTDWVRKRPAFILPKVALRILYTMDKSVPGRVVYRQQLVESNTVLTTDALVVLESLGADKTRISVLDFYGVSFGILGPLIRGKVWKKSMQNAFKDDIAFRARLEHPEWTVDRIADEADRVLGQFPIEDVEYTDLVKLEDHL